MYDNKELNKHKVFYLKFESMKMNINNLDFLFHVSKVNHWFRKINTFRVISVRDQFLFLF